MILRAATAADAPALAALHRDAFADAWGADDIAALFASPGAFAFAVDGPQSLAGFILARIAADEAEVLTLATAPDHRRRGVASALVAATRGAAEAAGARALFLEVAPDNAGAMALYDALGFSRVGERPRYYARPGGATGALILRLDLNR